MKKHITIFLCLVFSFFSEYSNSQKNKERKKRFDHCETIDLKLRNKLLKKVKTNKNVSSILKKLGDSYYFSSNYISAVKWYKKLIKTDINIDPEYYFRYSQSLKSNEDYDEAYMWMQKFLKAKPNDYRSKMFLSSPPYIFENTQKEKTNIEVENLNINTSFSDFGTVLYNDLLIFSSNRTTVKESNSENHIPFNLFYIKEKTKNTHSTPKKLTSFIDTKGHKSSINFSNDFTTTYFTQNCNIQKKKKSVEMRLRLFKANVKNDTLKNIQPLYVNHGKYNMAHPFVNKDGTKLYFVSDMGNNSGHSDLYLANIAKGGSLSDPINLGDIINTKGNETFPFINDQGDLFFSSNGFSGFGGLDIFVIRNFEENYNNGTPFSIENVGIPYNSPMDDFAYFEHPKGKSGYFSSNRKGGKGKDDIYSFKIKDEYYIGKTD